jgi:hypothetical protein
MKQAPKLKIHLYGLNINVKFIKRYLFILKKSLKISYNLKANKKNIIFLIKGSLNI